MSSGYNDQSDKLQHKISEITKQISELRKKKVSNASDDYDARITILTSQLALLNLELKKGNFHTFIHILFLKSFS